MAETPTKILRLIIKVPSHSQTGPDSWTDTSHYETFDLPCPAGLESFGKDRWFQAAIVGAEVVGAFEASKGSTDGTE